MLQIVRSRRCRAGGVRSRTRAGRPASAVALGRALGVALALLPAGAGCAASGPAASGAVRVASVYAPHRIDPSRNPQCYALTVTAPTEGEFRRRLAAARAGGPGRRLPPGVVVDAWLELDGAARLRASVSGAIAEFRLGLDGETVADLARGLNAAVSAPGEGWSTVTAELPAGILASGTDVSLVLRREGAERGVELTLEF